MKKLITLLAFTVLSVWAFSQSIIVNSASAPESSLTAEDLTTEVLIDGGACSSISNFQLKDNPSAPYPNANRSWGYFEKGNSDFPFEKGIVMTSGYAKDAEGPDTGVVSKGGTDWTGDSQASYLAGASTNNATVFEFDFVPFGNEISFNYIFASEEYPTFACTSFNDVFAFIISGPGITNDPGLTGKNIALLPNGNPVTINTVNDKSCGDANYYVPGPFQDIEYGGRTIPLTAYSEVIPNETYHIRLLIADAVDRSWDSAVFLEAGSFNLGSDLVDLDGVEIGEDEMLCDLTEYTMVVNVANAENASFQWYFNGTLIPGATESTYTATQSGHYLVEVFLSSCSTTAETTLYFSTSPEVSEPPPYSQCTETGTFNYDLTEFYSDITTDPDAVITYYLTEDGAINEIPLALIEDIFNFPVTGVETIYARVENEDGCFTVIPITMEAGIGPATNPFEVEVCDDNGDGSMVFDLTEYNSDLVVTNPNNLEFKYFTDPGLTQEINNPTEFENTANPQIIYVVITEPNPDGEDCTSVEQLTLFVDEFPEIQPDTIEVCDNLNDLNEIVDLTQNNIILTQGINVNLHYFLEIGGPEITNPQNFEVTQPETTVYVLVRNQEGSCEDYETLTVYLLDAPETVSDYATLINCSIDGYSTFHLPDANEQLVDLWPNDYTFTYHLSENDAQNGLNPLPENYQNQTPDQIVYVRITNETGCFDTAQIQLETEMSLEEIQDILTVCDDPYGLNDGIAVFDLTLMEDDISAVLGGGNFSIQYYLNIDNAITETGMIPNPDAFENTSNPQTIYARANSLDEGGCAGIVEFRVEVLSVPELDLGTTLLFCGDDSEKIFELDEPFSSYTWYDSQGDIISESNTIEFTSEGTYTLEVTAPGFDCPARRDVEIIFDNPTVVDVQIDDNNVSISVIGGYAPYKYSYDNGLTWQDEPNFYNLPGGVYELIIMSANGCISESYMFAVLGVTNVLTPNGDGYNDHWQLRGIDNFSNVYIRIFDRYGKIFVDRMIQSEFVWDGKYRGNPVPSGSYWYTISFGDEGKSITGHINVRNRN